MGQNNPTQDSKILKIAETWLHLGNDPWGGQEGGIASKGATLPQCGIAHQYLVYWHKVSWIGFNWHISFALWLEMTGAGHGFIEVLLYASLC